MTATQNVSYTPHPTYYSRSPCQLTNSLPDPTTYSISHHPSDFRSTVPQPSPLNAINYTTRSSSTHTQSLHSPQTSTLAPQTHYPTFPRIVIPPQYSGWVPAVPQLRLTTIFFYEQWCTMNNNNWTTRWRWWVQLQLPGIQGQTNLYSVISCNTQRLYTKKQKHKVQLIPELANNKNTLTITLTETHLNKKNNGLWDTNEELHWISCRSNLR